ncbi:lasso peptide biosynthesis B2 protein [Nocardia sp. NBC_00416]|uniref:lasso peptide biosynthesis B2 protein n=1 Tax=Nocardia sp. NBC_00416 TaxID=2975991 RepID=UPI003FA60CCA
MTTPVPLPSPRKLSLTEWSAGLFAVGAGRSIAHLPPLRITQLFRILRLGARPATIGEAAAARETVISISMVCAGEGCLPRSIAAALLCRVRGTWPRWCTGVCVEPFRAHAWIEAEGRMVGESATTDKYEVVLSVP